MWLRLVVELVCLIHHVIRRGEASIRGNGKKGRRSELGKLAGPPSCGIVVTAPIGTNPSDAAPAL